MKNPTKAQVQVVIDNLTKMLPKAKKEDALDMAETSVCGTTHCHGGWYMLAKFPKMTEEQRDSVGYSDGAKLLAIDLGGVGDRDLVQWAANNPKLWGNCNGGDMFSHEEAFYHIEKRPEGAKTLKDIVEHWKDVQSRLKK